MDLERLYTYRFKDVSQADRDRVWALISADVHRRMGRPQVVLDPAAGRGEFINSVPARERWAVDQVDHGTQIDPAVKSLVASALEVDLPPDYFEGIFVSNFLEHLPSPKSVGHFFARMHTALAPGGRIAVMGPNFRYCSRQYFDCADHVLPLSHVTVDEHLHAAGFIVDEVVARYLPYTFRSRLPASPGLVAAYLRIPAAHLLFGKQFLLVATKAA